ncbi:MAG: hypothetical protein JXA04_03180 [Gammaproteobacteria bacterium]|nr:hypothetical protein [Gammaproteobacteria bacterium]
MCSLARERACCVQKPVDVWIGVIRFDKLWGTEELGYSMREVADTLSISQPAVSYCEEERLTLDEVSY